MTLTLTPPGRAKTKSKFPVGYKCPKCFFATTVTDSRPREDGTVRRRRKCLRSTCRNRFTTIEGGEEFVALSNRKNIIHKIGLYVEEINTLLAEYRAEHTPND